MKRAAAATTTITAAEAARLRPTRLSPRNPKSRQLMYHETGPDRSKTSQPHRSG